MYNNSFSNRMSLLGDFGRISKLLSFHKDKKKELKLPELKHPIDFNKIRSKSLCCNKYKHNKGVNYKYSKIFPTSINETFYGNSNISRNNMKETLTESNIDKSKISKNDKNILEQSESNKYNNEEKNININIKPTSKFKEYKKFFETSSLIKNQGMNISNDIKNNPFMRKIEDLNKINHFEIIFHNNIMQNIKTVYEKTKKGFFKIEHTTKSKDALGTGYICENHNNIFSVSDMIERMNPLSTLKFSNLLRKDFREFLGYETKKEKRKIKDDLLRKRVIKKYNREIFFQNEFADKYNIKKIPGVKFIIDKEQEEKENNKQKQKKKDFNNTYNN